MFTHVFCFYAAVVGINVGWQPLQEGGTEYIIQLDPQSLEALKAGQPIESDILPGAGEVRSFKFYLGDEKPRRIGSTAKPAQQRQANAAQAERTPPSSLLENPDGSAVELPNRQPTGLPNQQAGKRPGQQSVALPNQLETEAQIDPFPRPLKLDPTAKPLAAPAAFNEPAGAARSEPAAQARSEANREEASKPWMTLILVSLDLIASLGGNANLAWIFAELRARYKKLSHA